MSDDASKPKISSHDWDKIIYGLLGTCQSLSQSLQDYDALELEDNTDFLSQLDNEIFNCETCGWWCEISEMVTEHDDDTDVVDQECEECYNS